MKIAPDTRLQAPQTANEADSKAGARDGTGFEEMVLQGIKEVNARMQKSKELSTALAAGEPVGLAETMIAGAKADVSFRFLLQVRNKALTAYEEIMRLQF